MLISPKKASIEQKTPWEIQLASGTLMPFKPKEGRWRKKYFQE
jgi:hypothetical protein